jgi:hypothetical protein
MLCRLPLFVNCIAAVVLAIPLLSAPITIVPELPASRYPLHPTSAMAGPLAVAEITSDYELRSVTATFETQTVALAFSPIYGDWRASSPFNIANSPSGPATLAFSVTDAFGNRAETNVSFVIDRFPTIEIHSPNSGALARPLLFLSGSTRDDLGTPHVSVWSARSVGIEYEWFMHNQQTTHPQGIIDLSSWEESPVDIKFQAYDSSGAYALQVRKVLSLSNPRYRPVRFVQGIIHDINAGAILYSSNSVPMAPLLGPTQLIAVNRATGEATVLKRDFGYSIWERPPRLTPTGALIVQPVIGSNSRLLDLNRGEEITLGTLGANGFFSIKGDFAVFNVDNQTILRDLVARTNYILPFPAIRADVAANGTLAFTVQSTQQVITVFRFADGQITQLTAPNEHASFESVQTDGTNVLWRRMETPGGAASLWSTILHTPQGLATLATNESLPPGGFLPSAMNSGWVAFPKSGTQGQQQIWLRSPTGEVFQTTFFSRSSNLRALLPNGSLLVSVGDDFYTRDLYAIAPGAIPKRLGTDVAHRLGRLGMAADYIVTETNISAHAFGNVFDLDITGDPVGLTSPQYDNASGLLSYYVTVTVPGLFTLQRSTNFGDWTAVTRVSVTNTLPTKFQTATSPGFFRLRAE